MTLIGRRAFVLAVAILLVLVAVAWPLAGANRAQAAPPLPPSSPSPGAAQPPGAPTSGDASSVTHPSGADPSPSTPTPSPVPPTAEMAAHAPAAPAEGAAGVGTVPDQQPTASHLVVTGDLARADSDHDAVVGAWGVEVRPVTTTLPVFSRRATTGCPLPPPAPAAGVAAAPEIDCPPIAVSMLGVRHWVRRNVAFDAGVALALGGGTQAGRLLDSYFGFGPGVGISLLLGNWRHLAVAASPALALVWFRAAGSAATTYVAELRADLEGELHFGFIGVPALSLGLRSGVLLRLEKAADLTLWSAGVSGATTLRGLVSDLSLRYYF